MSPTKGQKMTSKFTIFSSDEEPADRKSLNSSYGLTAVENAFPRLSTASINVEFDEDPDWAEFKFITKKKGAQGPTKEECKDYYTDCSYNHELHITVSDNGRMFKWIEPWLLVPDVSKDGFQTLTIPVSAEYKIELVAPGNFGYKHPGVRIFGKFKLKKGQKITAALGQQGSHGGCGSGGSFLVLESDEGQKPLLIAGGAGFAPHEFGRGIIKQTAVGNGNVGTSRNRVLLDGHNKDVYCAGAGYNETPRVSNLAVGCVAPKSYKEGLTGGKGNFGQGGFGGGGGSYKRSVNGKWKYYYGAGGGFTGGSTKVGKNKYGTDCCWGGGGGSFSADPKAEFDHHYVEYGYCKIKKL